MREILKILILDFLSLNYLFTKGKRRGFLDVCALIFIGVAPLYGMYNFTLFKIFDTMAKHQIYLFDLIPTAVYSLTQIFVFMAGLFLVYGQIFQSRDMNILIPLPYRQFQILGAKIALLYLIELMISLLFMIPCFVLFHYYASPGIVSFINGIINILLLPVIPIVIFTLIALLITNIPVIGRSKWLLNILIAFVGLGLIPLQYYLFSMFKQDFKGAAGFVELLRTGMDKVQLMGRFFPGSDFAITAMIRAGLDSMLYQVFNLLVVGGYLALLYICCEKFYFKGLYKGGQITTRRKNHKLRFQSRAFLHSYIQKEFRVVFKEPMIAINSVFIYVIVFIAALLPAIFNFEKIEGLRQGIDYMNKIVSTSELREFHPYVMIAIALVSVFLGTSSTLFASSYTKDGKKLWIEKSIPVKPFQIFLGKWLMGMITVGIPNMLTISLVKFYFGISWNDYFFILMISEIIIGYIGLFSLMIDCRWAKTNWKNIVHAVKQNLNVLAGILSAYAIIIIHALLLLLFYSIRLSDGFIYFIVFSMNLLIFILLFLSAIRYSRKINDLVV